MFYQANDVFTSDPAGGTESLPTLGLSIANRARVVSAIPMADPSNGVLGRIGISFLPARVETAANPGGLPIFYTVRWLQPGHAPYSGSPPTPIDAKNDANVYFDVIEVPPATEVVVPHTLDEAPTMALFQLAGSGLLEQGVDWAVTEISDSQFKIRNWDAVETILVFVTTYRESSVYQPKATTLPRPVVTLSGTGVVSVPHGLGRAPDLVCAFPYVTDGVQPSGLPIMDSAPDNTNVYLRNVAGGDMPVMVTMQATHSVQL